MTFAELLARLGGMGRFQVWYVASLAVPLLMLASHNVLQNFTAGVPEHHCRPRAAANGSAADVPLVVAIPHDGHQRPQRCRRFVEHQWGLLGANGTNGTGGSAATEPCRDGWTYRDGIFTRTVVTEVWGVRGVWEGWGPRHPGVDGDPGIQGDGDPGVRA